MNRHALLRAAPPAVLALLLAGGCRHAAEGAGSQASSAKSAKPRQGGTVAIGWQADIAGVNELILPSANNTNDVLFRVFDHLIEEQPDFTEHPPTMKPQLATSWEFSDDRKTVTVHLQPKAVWTDGVPLTADDVRFTWQAQTSPDISWSDTSAKQFVTDVEVVDAHTVRFHFSRSYAKQLLDLNEGLILPKHAWGQIPFAKWRQSGDWFREHLVSSGPFKIASWKPQQEIVLARNERYYEPGVPRLDRAVLRIVSEAPSQLAQMQNGELQFATNVQPADALRIQADPKLELRAIPFRTYVGVAWNNRSPLFSDARVRRALTLAIDRHRIVDTLWGPYAKVAVSPILSFIWAHDKTIQPLPYDPAQAKKLLEESGFRDRDGDGVLDREGRPFRFELLTNSGNQQRVDAGVMIQDQLKQVGVAVVPRVVEFNALAAQLDGGTFDAVTIGLGMDTSLDLTTAFDSRAIQDGNNFARYAHPEMDRLLATAASQPDIDKTVPILHRIEALVQRDQPWTYLWESQRLMAINRRVHDVQPSPAFVLFNLRSWWVEPAGTGAAR
ncbi:MAG TPA: ABC transporter substrate-binding protein [Thermoanaerobaculia bacterium]|nr:ABC transporter substrate-binding protein [Thermoanaerobaculia bacterium]